MGKRVLGIIAVVIVALAAVWVLAGEVRVPLRFDTTRVTSMQLNGGTLALQSGGRPELRASVPLRTLPLLMVRRTDGLLEVGGFDDSDPRILLAFLLPMSDVPVGTDDIGWEMTGSRLERITIAGGELRASGYTAERLILFGVAGDAVLRDIEVGTLGIHLQDPARVTVSGHAGTFGIMNSGGTADTSGLSAEEYDATVITDEFDDK